MWSSADGEFRSCGVHYMECLGVFSNEESSRCGVQEMVSSTCAGVEEMWSSGNGDFRRWGVKGIGSSRDGDCST